MTVKHVQLITMDPVDAQVYVGPEGELIIERDTYLVRVQDGVTPGGQATLTLAVANSLYQTIVDFNTTFDDLESSLQDTADEAIADLHQTLLIAEGPVTDLVTSLASAPPLGTRVLIAGGGTSGTAVGKENRVAEFLADGWMFSDLPLEGHVVYVQDEDINYYFNGAAWTTTPVDTTLVDALADIASTITSLAAKANLASPALTGTPTAPTAASGTDNTQIATTAFVNQAFTDFVSDSLPGTLASTGTTTLPNGLILKWGHYAGGSSHPTVNFATAFPSACYGVQITSVGTAADVSDAANNNEVRYTQLDGFDEAGFTAWCSAEHGIEDVFHAYTAVDFYWFAYGS